MSRDSGAYRPETNTRIGTGVEANGHFSIGADDWFRSYDEKTFFSAASGSERLRDAIQRTGQAIAPAPKRERLTFEEQLALVASGRAQIVEWGGR